MDNTKREWRWKMAGIVARSLEFVEHTCHIITIRAAHRSRIGDLIERAEHEENVRSLVGLPGEDSLIAGPPDARLCWALCSGKTVRELIGPVDAIRDVSMLIQAVEHDERAIPFAGLIEDHTLPELSSLLLEWSPTEEDPGIPVKDPVDSTVRVLSLMHPFLILRIANRACGVNMFDSSLSGDGFPSAASSSEPPPLN